MIDIRLVITGIICILVVLVRDPSSWDMKQSCTSNPLARSAVLAPGARENMLGKPDGRGESDGPASLQLWLECRRGR